MGKIIRTPLEFRRSVDFDLIRLAERELNVMKVALVEERGILTPDRRSDLMEAIQILQNMGPGS